jgi:putative transposase
MKCEAIHRYRRRFTIGEMCLVLGLSTITYYKWLKMKECHKSRILAEKALVKQVIAIFIENKRIYGYRKMQHALDAKDIKISVYKIRKIMRENGLYPELVKKFKPYPNKKSDGKYSENLLKQKFHAENPNKIWAGDITYIKTTLGWVYLSVVMDLYNREIIGYSVSKEINTELVKRSLSDALAKVDGEKSIIFHSDRGVQYSSISFNEMLRNNGLQPSMSRYDCPYDNSCVEGFLLH